MDMRLMGVVRLDQNSEAVGGENQNTELKDTNTFSSEKNSRVRG